MKNILEKIIHTFIPHEKNNNVPHILQAEAIFALILIVGALFYFNQYNFKIIRNFNLTATVYPSVLADLTNKDRKDNGTPELNWNESLEKAAKLKAEDMLQNSYFAHTSPTGITPWHWLSKVDYNFIYAGENLAVDFTESENVENAWLNSPKHRENIMNNNFTEIGIATAEGVYNGHNTTFVVEFFGKPINIKDQQEIAETNKLAVVEKEEKPFDNVAGASVQSTLEQKDEENIKLDDPTGIKTIEETDKFIVVQNDNVKEIAISNNEQQDNNLVVDNEIQTEKKLSTWYDRFIVNPTKTILGIYVIILVIIFISTFLMLTKEYKKHHRKHLAMGFAMMFVLAVLIYTISFNNINLIL